MITHSWRCACHKHLDKPANMYVCACVSVCTLISQTPLLPVCVQRRALSALICASVQKEERRSCKVVVKPPDALFAFKLWFISTSQPGQNRGCTLLSDECCHWWGSWGHLRLWGQLCFSSVRHELQTGDNLKEKQSKWVEQHKQA